MSTTLTNMGLVSWTSGNDFFSSSDLSANWSKVDAHDHTTGKGVQIPTAGLANGAVTGAKLAADAVDGSKILDGSVSSAELGSNSVTTVKITDANVTTAKILDTNVTLAKLAADAAPQILVGATGGSATVTPSTITDLLLSQVSASSGLSIASNKAVITTAGKYLISVTIDFQTAGTETDRSVIFSGSTLGIFASAGVPGVHPTTRNSLTLAISLPANEQITVRAWHNGSVSKTVDVRNFVMSRLSL